MAFPPNHGMSATAPTTPPSGPAEAIVPPLLPSGPTTTTIPVVPPPSSNEQSQIAGSDAISNCMDQYPQIQTDGNLSNDNPTLYNQILRQCSSGGNAQSGNGR